MTIDIKGGSIDLTEEQVEEIVAKHLAKQKQLKHLPKGTICWVWDEEEYKKPRVADGNGKFYDHDKAWAASWEHYEPIEMGLQFPDEVIKSKDIKPEMHKQLALCWGSEDKTTKALRVIDGKNKCTFRYCGARNGNRQSNYQLCTTPYPNLPQWAKDMINSCKD